MSAPKPDLSDRSSLDGLKPRALFQRGLSVGDSVVAVGTPSDVSPEASAVDNAMEAALAQLFPEYKIEGKLGGGGGGSVYAAGHRRLKRRVAIKTLSAALTRSTSAIARFEREIEAVGQLDDPRIVRAFDGGNREGVWFLAMELVEGADFGTISRALGPLSAADACELIRQAALALQHAHERRLIHRDVKPGNLMLTRLPDGSPLVKVLDFGLAQLTRGETAGGDLTISGELLGTVDYVAPEQITNPRTVNERADIYGLGATLYRLLCGRAPHQAGGGPTESLYAKLTRISHRPCPAVSEIRADLPGKLAAVVDRMVALDPAQRFASAGEVAEALAPFAAGNDVASLLSRMPDAAPYPAKTQAGRSRPVSSGRRLAIYVAAAAVLGIGIPLSLLFTRKTSDLIRSRGRPVASLENAASPRGITWGGDGAFYGGAIWGGAYGHGVLYKFTPEGAVEKLVDLTGTNGPARGRMPGRQLVLARDGLFYGVCERGGEYNQGTVFRFDPVAATNRFTTLWDFNEADGGEPLAGLIEDRKTNGVFYGGTQTGGAGGSGTVFRIDVTGARPVLHVLAHFSGDTGTAPGRRLVSGLAQTEDGMLFGTTPEGGAVNGGTVFRLSPAGGFTSLVSFGGRATGFYNPTGGITLGGDGNLYGTCHLEHDGNGALFRISPEGKLDVVTRFGPPHGSQPGSTLLCAPDGSLYGTTLLGGTYNRGTLFKVGRDGTMTTLLSFPDFGAPTTAGPWGLPALDAEGNLYGSVELGGGGEGGLVYQFKPGGAWKVLVELVTANHVRR
jgi:uncharacterized repeat protein (TIGR03803 family)